MKIRRIHTLTGSNIWAYFPVLEALVDLGEDYRDLSSDAIPGFNERLKQWLPGLVEHQCSPGVRRGFHQRLERGTYLAHILEHVALELQGLAGIGVSFGRARETEEEGVYRVAIRYEIEEVGRAALETGVRLLLACVHDEPFSLGCEIDALKTLAYDYGYGPSTLAVVEAARIRRIPVMRYCADWSLVQLGQGKFQRRIWAASMDTTSWLGETIAKDKAQCGDHLREAGVPVPVGYAAGSVEDACENAEDLGFPVVVKPLHGNHGRNVSLNLNSVDEVAEAFYSAIQQDTAVLVETFANGDDYRLLVVGDQMVAAALREPPCVIGDGKSSVRKLAESLNEDPRRTEGHGSVLSCVPIEDAETTRTLRRQGLALDDIAPVGQKILLRENANLSTGGTARDVTEDVHPAVAKAAVRAAKSVRLDLAGVDVVATDITMPLEDQGGMVIEVNAGPGLRMHLEPSDGVGRPVGEAILDQLFDANENGRIHSVHVSGLRWGRQLAHRLRDVLGNGGCFDGETLFVGAREVAGGLTSQRRAVRALMMNPEIEACVVHGTPMQLYTEGLVVSHVNVGIVTDMSQPDTVLQADLDHEDLLHRVMRIGVETIEEDGICILNADDPLVMKMAETAYGEKIFFTAQAPTENEKLTAHMEAGGRWMRYNAKFGEVAHYCGAKEVGSRERCEGTPDALALRAYLWCQE